MYLVETLNFIQEIIQDYVFKMYFPTHEMLSTF